MSLAAHPDSTADHEVVRLRTLYDFVSRLNRCASLDDAYSAALDTLLASTSADRAAILLSRPHPSARLHVAAWRNLPESFRAYVIDHPELPQPDHFLSEGIRAMSFFPLPGAPGKLLLCSADPNGFGAADQQLAGEIAGHLAPTIERLQKEQAYRCAAQQLETILDHTAAVISLKDLEGRYLLINRHYEELFHVNRRDIIGRTDRDIFPADLATRLEENDRRSIAAGDAVTFEESALQDDGLHDYISIKFPLVAPDGSLTGICGISTDITDHKKMHAAALHLTAVIENSDDAIITKDLNGIITTWNIAAERIFGYTAEEAVGRPVTMLAADRLDEMPDILSKIRRGERVDHFETRRRRKDGRVIDISLTVSPIREAGGEIVGASKIARVITDRKHAEVERAALLAAEQEARVTAELLNRIAPRLAAELDVQKLAQAVTDTATLLAGAEFGAFFHNVVNEKGESYLLYTLSGVPADAFSAFPMPRNTAVFAPTFAGEAIVRSDDITQDPRYGKSGPHFGMPQGHLPVRSYLAAPVTTRSGEVLGGLFFGHSVPGRFTENHEAIIRGIAAQAATAMDNARLFRQSQWTQNELTRSNEDLRRANQDLEVFAYSASHDLQEPLRTISLSAQLLERTIGKQLQGEDAVFFDRILIGARRMNNLIQDLLAYTQATKYAEGPPPAVDPAEVLKRVLDNLRTPIEESRAVITFDQLPVLQMHEPRLAQLFQNLISNAVKYRLPEVSPRVQISAEERDGWLVFSIADNGIGIEPAYTEQIFGLFKRLHTRERYPGSGIGLAICQRIVEHYSGRIWLEQSVPGSGSVFCFAVPARPR